MRVLLLVLFLPFNNWSQDTLNQIDENGLRQGYWIVYEHVKSPSGAIDSVKSSEGTYVNNRKEGTWVRYFPDGETPRLRGNYLDNKPFGYYIKFYPTGIVQEEGTFQYGKYIGDLKFYREDGTLKELVKHDEFGRINKYRHEFIHSGNVVDSIWIKDGNHLTSCNCMIKLPSGKNSCDDKVPGEFLKPKHISYTTRGSTGVAHNYYDLEIDSVGGFNARWVEERSAIEKFHYKGVLPESFISGLDSMIIKADFPAAGWIRYSPKVSDHQTFVDLQIVNGVDTVHITGVYSDLPSNVRRIFEMLDEPGTRKWEVAENHYVFTRSRYRGR